MAKQKKTKDLLSVDVVVAENRKAKFDYFLEEFFEAGIMLTGTEVKSLRHGQCSLAESHAITKKGDIYLMGCTIAPYGHAGIHLQHTPTRPRKLLLHRREINKLMGRIKIEGYTLVPVKMFFNARGIAKCEIALAKGKKAHDKRETIKERDWNREKSRVLRGNQKD
jgi:SsrA-binding protein